MTVTWSFAPDATDIGGAFSSLIAPLDATFGSGPGGPNLAQRPWFQYFDAATARLSAVSGVTYIYEPHDDGVAFGTSAAASGALGIRGDVRLSGKSYGSGNNTLASSYFPSFSEVMINSDLIPYLSAPAYNHRRLLNMLMHELMHGLGVNHINSTDADFLIEPVLGETFDGPQLDDVLVLQRLYGDALEKNGGNDSAGSATVLGSFSAGGSLVRGTLGDSTAVSDLAVDFLSIDDDSDFDYFSFTLTDWVDVTLAVTPKGATYQMAPPNGSYQTYNSRSLSDLSLALFDSSGVIQIGAINANGAGAGESMTSDLGPGTYVCACQAPTMMCSSTNSRSMESPPPRTALTWIGSAGTAWNVGSTANFNNGTASDVFLNGDSVLFNDSAATRNISVSQQVAPAAMFVNSVGNFRFTGTGIVVSGLTVQGGGTAELANSGNALSNLDVREGTLKISGVNNSPLGGSVRVAAGATLQLVGAQPFAAASQLTGAGQVVGGVSLPGTIAPGDNLGTLSIVGNLTLANSSVVAIELGGTTVGVTFDMLNVSGTLVLDGVMNVTLANGFQPTAGMSFSVLTAGQISGAFDATTFPQIASGLTWHANVSSSSVVLSISANVTYNPADFTENGVVDGADLDAWRDGLNATWPASHAQGDATGDGYVDGADFLVWQRGLTAGGVTTTVGVPEPHSVLLTIAAIAAWNTATRTGSRSWRRRAERHLEFRP